MSALEELKKIAEEKMGMSWEKILEQADEDTANQKRKAYAIEKAHKKSSISPNSMFKKSMKDMDAKMKMNKKDKKL